MSVGVARPIAELRCRPAVCLAFVGLVHRSIVFFRFHTSIDDLASHLRGLAQIQLYPITIYRAHFWASIWLLQQTPPIPHLIVKLFLTWADYPSGFTHLLFILQSGCTIATACATYAIIVQVTASRIVGFCISLWFLLSTDLLVMENVFSGQAFSDALAMLFVTLSCKVAVGGAADAMRRRPGDAAWVGLFATLAALTRSSLSYFAFMPITAVWPCRRVTVFVAFLAPVVVLQGGWALKNKLAFGQFAWETSTWGGFSAAKGLEADGQGHLLCDFVEAQRAGAYPAWFAGSLVSCPFPFVNSADYGMPSSVQDEDENARLRLGGLNPQLNTVAARMRSDAYRGAVVHYGIKYPRRMARRIVDLYPLFWQRIADYGRKFGGVFAITTQTRGLFDFSDRGFHDAQEIGSIKETRHGGPPSFHKEALWTVSLAPLDAAAIVALHGIFPILAFLDILRRLRRRRPVFAGGIWVLAGTVFYGLIVFNVVDAGENNRFRLAIEPAILALTASCLVVPFRAFANGLRLLLRRPGRSSLSDQRFISPTPQVPPYSSRSPCPRY